MNGGLPFGSPESRPVVGHSVFSRAVTWASFAGLVAVVALQMMGPSDLFHQTQPRTVAYTADILVNGRWALPREQGEMPATKPPLYNWLAAPFVLLLGFDSELAHKMPSILALIACWAMTMWLGRRFASAADHECASVISALASLMLVASYTIYKLGYLARPDMLLTLWFLLAWWAATEALLRETARDRHQESQRIDGNRALVATFWAAIALAWLTKGPVAIVPLVYAIVAARLLCGRYSAARALRWKWGLPLSLLPFLAWLFAAYDIDPEHVLRTLWRDEFLGRILGDGPEADEEGAIGLLTGLYKMPYYFLLRGAPWSLLAVAGLVLFWRRRRDPGSQGTDQRLRAGAIWIVVVLAFFTLSAGKRADYIAGVYPISSMLAAWALLQIAGSMRRAVLTGTLAAAIAIGALGLTDWREWPSPLPRGYGISVNRFIDRADRLIRAEPRHLAFWRLPDTHMQTFLGRNEPHSTEHLLRTLRRNNRLWLVAGERTDEESAGMIDLERQSFVDRFNLMMTPVLSSDDVEGGTLWPRRVTLYRVEGERRRRQSSD